MQVTKVALTSFDKIEFPDTLYKYRYWVDHNHRKLVTERQIFFAPPDSFKDTFDCKIPTRWDLLTEKEIYNKYLIESKEANCGFSRQQHRAFARYWTKKNLIRNEEHVTNWQKLAFEKHNERIGILCLTAFPDNKIMWNSYSNSHAGFCVGFDPKILLSSFPGAGGPVNYFVELPIIYPIPKHDHNTQSILQVYSKLREWEFEREYRSYIFKETALDIDERIKKVPIAAFKEIILGALMPEKDIEELIGSLATELNFVRIRKAQIDENENIHIIDWT